MGYFPPQGVGVSKLSQLVIDVDKDWQVKGIYNIKELASGMTKGDLLVKGNTILQKIMPGSIGYVLTSAGPLKIPVWAPGAALEIWLPILMEIDVDAALYTPDHSAALTLPLTSPHDETTTPTRAHALGLTAAGAIYTPDYSAPEVAPVTTGYQAEAHVANAFGHFSIGANSISIENIIRGSRFMCIDNCTAQSITAYVQVVGAGVNLHVKCGLYNYVENKIDETNQLVLAPGAAAWQTFPFDVPPALTGGQEYWLLVWGESVVNLDVFAWYDNVGAIGLEQGLFLAQVYDGFPGTLAGRTIERTKFSIYCNFV